MTCFVLQARVALRLPWWSLASGLAATRDLAGFQGSAIQVHKALTEQTMAANGALPPGAMSAKDNRQVTWHPQIRIQVLPMQVRVCKQCEWCCSNRP